MVAGLEKRRGAHPTELDRCEQHGWRQLLYRCIPYISVGGNLSDDASCNFLSEPSDLNDTEDNLGPLADNGGLNPDASAANRQPSLSTTLRVLPLGPARYKSTTGIGLRHRRGRSVGRRATPALRQPLHRRCLEPRSGNCPPNQQTLVDTSGHILHQPLYRSGHFRRSRTVRAAQPDAPDAGRWSAPDLRQPLHRRKPGGRRPQPVSRLRAAEHHPGNAVVTNLARGVS